MNAVIGKVTPLLLASIDFYLYAVFGGIGLAMGLFTLVFVPETMGKSLEDMEQVFGSVGGPREDIERSKKIAAAGGH